MATKVGRKRQSPIWNYFKYDEETEKSKCLVVESGCNMCGILLKGKNPTNLKVHLRSSHKKANSEYLNKVASLSNAPEKEATCRPGGSTVKEETVKDYFHPRAASEPSPEQASVHSPLPHTRPGSSPVPNPTEAPSVGTSLPSNVSAPAEASNCSPAAPVPSIDSASFWKSCNEAGFTETIFTSFIREMNDVAGRIQSDQASQEDYDLALSVMQASGKMITIVTKQHEEIQQKQMELEKAAASMKKVLSVLKR